MKSINTLFMGVGLSILILTSCTNSDNKKTSEKELELQKRELAIKQKELELKEKELNQKEASSKNETVKPTVNTLTVKSEQPKAKTSSGGYNFDQHNDIKVFINDLAKAVSTTDKEAISKMVNFPLVDDWGDNPFNKSESLGCKTLDQFMQKFNKIFTPEIVRDIKAKKYRGFSDNTLGDVINKGEYLIEGTRDTGMFGIKKVNGKFKVYALKFYS